MARSMARGSESCTTSKVNATKSHAWVGMTAPVLSARASDSSWLTVWVARMLERPICTSDFLSSSALAPARCAKSACMRKPARGVLSWCAASAKKRFWVAIESFSRVSKSLMDDTSGATSRGTTRSSRGLKSSGLRNRMRSSSWLSGLMPRAKASHTSSTAKGKMTNWGSITPLMISVASTERLPKVSPTCTRAAGLSMLWG